MVISWDLIWLISPSSSDVELKRWKTVNNLPKVNVHCCCFSFVSFRLWISILIKILGRNSYKKRIKERAQSNGLKTRVAAISAVHWSRWVEAQVEHRPRRYQPDHTRYSSRSCPIIQFYSFTPAYNMGPLLPTPVGDSLISIVVMARRKIKISSDVVIQKRF